MASPAQIKSAPLQPDNWILAAFSRLSSEGVESVRVEVLARDAELLRIAPKARLRLPELDLRAVVVLDRRFEIDPDPVDLRLHSAGVSLLRTDLRRGVGPGCRRDQCG